MVPRSAEQEGTLRLTSCHIVSDGTISRPYGTVPYIDIEYSSRLGIIDVSASTVELIGIYLKKRS